jgi:predicted AlkP superfamily phosphohydrolase/phosphomutase
VEEKDAAALKTQLKEKLLGLTYAKDGADVKVLKSVFFKEDIYSGPHLEAAPDLVLVSKHGYDLKGSIKQKTLFGRSDGLHGMHTQDDAFFYINHPGTEIKNISEAGKLLLQTLT